MYLPQSENEYLKEKLVECAVDGMFMQREIDFIKSEYESLSDNKKKQANIRLLKLEISLNNCDNYLKQLIKGNG